MPNAKASVLEQFNAPLRCTEFPLPDKLETGAALVRTEMAGICGTDVHLWKGQLPISLPIILGHETVGCIEQLAEGIERDWTGHPLKIGDRVTWTSTTSCGECYYCKVKRQPTRCPERRWFAPRWPASAARTFTSGKGNSQFRCRLSLGTRPSAVSSDSVKDWNATGPDTR